MWLPLVALTAWQSAAWQVIDRADGWLLEGQTFPGDAQETLRVSGHADVPPEAYRDAVWGEANDQHASKEVMRREVLDAKPGDRIYYETVHAPIVSDRDYVIHTRFIEDAATRVYEMRF